MPLFDEEVKRYVDKAVERGYVGRAIAAQVAVNFNLYQMTKAERDALDDAFKRIVHPAAKQPRDESKQTKLF